MLNTAIIGAGYWGTNIVRVLSELSYLKYICDLDIHLLNRKYSENKKFNDIVLTDDYLDILLDKEVEAVFVATPPETHYKIAHESISNGKHVFIEKPMTASSKEAEKLIKLAKSKKVKLAVGHTFLYSAPVKKVKNIIDSGELGNILHIDMCRKNLGKFQANCDVIYDLAPHDLSMLIYWIDGFNIDKANVSIFGHFKGLQQDTSSINIVSTGGLTVSLTYSWLYPCKIRDTYIIGDKKSLLYNDTDPNSSIVIYDKAVEPTSPTNFGDFICSYRTGDCHIPYVKIEEPLKKEVSAFLDAVSFDEDIINDGENGKKVVSMIEKLRSISPLEVIKES